MTKHTRPTSSSLLSALVLLASFAACESPQPEPRKAAKPHVIIRPVPLVRFRGANSASPDRPGDSDCNSPAHWNDATFYVFNSAGHPWRSGGANLFHLEKSYERCEYDDTMSGGRWIECTWKAEDGVLYGWYLNEPTGLCPGTTLTAPRIGAVRSTDDGATWHDLGIVLEAPVDSLNCATKNLYFAGGHGDFCITADAGPRYVYFYFSTYLGGAADQGVAVARMRYADREQPVGKVWKWYAGKWKQPGVGGLATPIFPAAVDWHRADADAFWGPSIHWNWYLQKYVMLLNRAIDKDWTQEGIYISYCDDLAEPGRWSEPQKILGGLGKDRWYPQVIGLNTAKRETDKLAGDKARLFVRGESRWQIRFLRPDEPE